eukprot:658165-Pyramimonas_sp.AAC.1
MLGSGHHLVRRRHQVLPLATPALLARPVQDDVGDDVGLQLPEHHLAQQRHDLLPLTTPALLAFAVQGAVGDDA